MFNFYANHSTTKRLLVLSAGIRRLGTLPRLLPEYRIQNQIKPGKKRHLNYDAVAGWGRKKSGLMACQIAQTHGYECVILEDGFLRSLEFGNTEDPMSIIVDHSGVYYDARSSSDLEQYIQRSLTDTEVTRARSLLRQWQISRVSKYNCLPEYSGTLPANYVLVVDQTLGDASIKCGLGSVHSFSQMLSAALENHPDSTIVVKIHPDVLNGRKKGNYSVEELRQNKRILVFAIDAHPVRLIENAQAIYVVTSQMGFEGLLWGKPVYTFGMPFYAGYGLTHDALNPPDRRQPVSLEQLVHGTLVCYPRYLDPETMQRCEPEHLMAWIALQRRMRSRFSDTVYAPGFSKWQKPVVKGFFQGANLILPKRLIATPRGEKVAVWGMRDASSVTPTEIIRLENGFLHLLGPQANSVRSYSWVMDRTGLYYDATRPSDLENILAKTEFDEVLTNRAQQLRERIIQRNISHRHATDFWHRPSRAKKVILVPGQNTSDPSIKFGAPHIKNSLDLLQAVRKRHPDAYILYKPHHNTATRRRGESKDGQAALNWCDELVDDSIRNFLTDIDECHVLTSLVGLEALMHGMRVVTYGQPFYAGWGLTDEQYPIPRRTRTLTLDELIAGAFILYPVYLSKKTGRCTTPERMLDEISLEKYEVVSALSRYGRFILQFFGKLTMVRRKNKIC